MSPSKLKKEKADKLQLINRLMKQKKVFILDDYSHDVFTDKNGKELFSVMSSRGFSPYPEKEMEVLDTIIANLKNIE
jgi:hypothetical protein